MNKKLLLLAGGIVLLVIILLGVLFAVGVLQIPLFERNGGRSSPRYMSVEVVSPEDGDQVQTGEPVFVFALVSGSQPVEAISFWVDEFQVDMVLVEGEWSVSYLADFEWTPTESGAYSLTARAILEDGTTLDSEPVIVNAASIEVTATPTSIPVPTEDEPDEALEEAEEEDEDDTDYSRCDLFDPGDTSLILLDIPIFTTDLTLYITLPTAVPGLEEDIPGDDGNWEYSAILGNETASSCSFMGYENRLYCTFEDFPTSYFWTSQPLDVYVNGCSQPIYSHGWVSIMKPACEADMDEDACDWTEGDWECVDEDDEDTCECVCPDE